MPPPLFTLDRPSLEILRRMVHDEMRRTKADLSRERQSLAVPSPRAYVGVTQTAISAGSVATPGTGYVSISRYTIIGDIDYATNEFNTVRVVSMFGEIPVSHTVLIMQDTAGTFWVLQPQITTRYRGQLQGALASGDSTKVVDNLVLVSGFDWGISSLTAHNVCAWAAADNNAVYVEYVSGASRWEMYQVKC